MKRKNLILTFFIANFCLFFYAYAKDISVDELFIRIENDINSYENKLYKNKEKSLQNLIKDNKLGDFNGFEVSSNFNAAENSLEDRTRKYDKTLQNKVSYGPFFINYNYVESHNNYISYGIEKNIKDIFYSPYNSELEINLLNIELNKLEYIKNIEDRKIDLLGLYQNILDTKNEINYRKEAKNYYETEVKRLKNMFDLGMEAKISLEASEVELEDLKLKIEILNKRLASFYEIGKNDYDINFEEYKMKDIKYNGGNIDEYIDKYMELDLKEIELNIKILSERVKYNKYDSFMPDIVLGFERIDKNERYGRMYKGENVFSIKFSKKLFTSDITYKNSQIEEQKLIDSLEEKKKDLISERLKLVAEHENLQKTAQISEKKLEIARKRYEIKRKENELNRVSYLDVIDSYNTYLAQEIETKKANNDYNSFMYRIAIKADYGVNSEKKN